MRLLWGSLVLTLICLQSAFGQTSPAQLMSQEELASLIEDAYSIYSADFARADSIFSQARSRARQQGWTKEEAGALRILGVIHYLQGDYEGALPLYQASLDLAESLGDRRGQAAVLNEIGNFFIKRKEFDRAETMLLRSADDALAARDTVLYSTSLDMQGRIKLYQQDLAAAGKLWNEVLLIRRQIKDTVGLSYVFDNLSALAAQRAQTETALSLLDSSIYIRGLLQDRQGEAIAINNQGEVLLSIGDTVKAIPYFERSLQLSRAVGFVDLQQWTLGLLAASYASAGDLSRALRIQQETQTLKDSLYNVETTARIAEMQEKYESQKRASELAEERARLRQRTAWLLAACFGVLALVLGMVMLVRRQKARREKLMQEAESSLRQNQLRISRDLHDHMGAELSIVASRLGRLNREIGDNKLEEVNQQVREAMTQMRETIWAVRSEEATWQDLFDQLQGFADKLEHDNIQFQLASKLVNTRLSPQHLLEIYRIGQEALRNAVRHAQADTIIVSADESGFSVSDNGKGTPADQAGSYGLASMRERAKELGATLDIAGQPGIGTTVRLNW